MNGPFLFLLATGAAYRLWRLVALDDLPGWRDLLDRAELAVTRRAGDRWAAGLACPWCSGWWCTVVVFAAVDMAGLSVPAPVLQVAASSTIVGLVGSRLDG